MSIRDVFPTSLRNVLRVVLVAGLGATFAVVSGEKITSAAAPPGHFTVGTGAGAGTVFDTKTSLTWQQVSSTSEYTWTAAKGVCAGLTLDGGGWRLPTLPELMTLVDFSKTSGPFIDTTAFPGTPSDMFWSATAVVGSTSSWPVRFDTGQAVGIINTTPGYVRCVR